MVLQQFYLKLPIKGIYDYDFLKETQSIRESDWKINPIPEELLNRQVEITGPVEKKMIIKLKDLNNGFKVFIENNEKEDNEESDFSDTPSLIESSADSDEEEDKEGD
ncbi:MAG: hypothetical protein HRT42_13950, partial [Campylobacteraceae bacterium]|nr:hypothetical protein [Campylobacteraceae bacterium]